jgi:hypothetical protein
MASRLEGVRNLDISFRRCWNHSLPIEGRAKRGACGTGKEYRGAPLEGTLYSFPVERIYEFLDISTMEKINVI